VGEDWLEFQTKPNQPNPTYLNKKNEYLSKKNEYLNKKKQVQGGGRGPRTNKAMFLKERRTDIFYSKVK